MILASVGGWTRGCYATANRAKNLNVERCHMLVDVGGLLRSVDEKSAEQICNLYGQRLNRFYFEKRTFDDLISGELKENLIGTCEALRVVHLLSQ